MNTTFLDKNTATKSISGARTGNQPTTDFLEIKGIKKTNFRSLTPPTIQKEIDAFIGTGNATILLRRF